MIEQVPGKIYYKQLMDLNTKTLFYGLGGDEYPSFSNMVYKYFERRESHYLSGTPLEDIHEEHTIKKLPKPNNYIKSLEGCPHVWHFKDIETGIEFLLFSDLLWKSCFKGSSIEVMCDKNGNYKNDLLLSKSYDRLMKYIINY